MNRCDKHKKDYVGTCNWCGKKACEYCIQRQEGKKVYCEKCMPLIGHLRREPRPTTIAEVPRGPAPAKGRKFVLQDGYLVIEGGM